MAWRHRDRCGRSARALESPASPRARRSSWAPSPLRAWCRTRNCAAERRVESRPEYEACGRIRKGGERHLSPATSSRRAPAPLRDVADLAHAAEIGVGDALPGRTAVAIGVETPGGLVQQDLLVWRGTRQRAPVLRRHVHIERGEAAVLANGDLT